VSTRSARHHLPAPSIICHRLGRLADYKCLESAKVASHGEGKALDFGICLHLRGASQPDKPTGGMCLAKSPNQTKLCGYARLQHIGLVAEHHFSKSCACARPINDGGDWRLDTKRIRLSPASCGLAALSTRLCCRRDRPPRRTRCLTAADLAWRRLSALLDSSGLRRHRANLEMPDEFCASSTLPSVRNSSAYHGKHYQICRTLTSRPPGSRIPCRSTRRPQHRCSARPAALLSRAASCRVCGIKLLADSRACIVAAFAGEKVASDRGASHSPPLRPYSPAAVRRNAVRRRTRAISRCCASTSVAAGGPCREPLWSMCIPLLASASQPSRRLMIADVRDRGPEAVAEIHATSPTRVPSLSRSATAHASANARWSLIIGEVQADGRTGSSGWSSTWRRSDPIHLKPDLVFTTLSTPTRRSIVRRRLTFTRAPICRGDSLLFSDNPNKRIVALAAAARGRGLTPIARAHVPTASPFISRARAFLRL